MLKSILIAALITFQIGEKPNQSSFKSILLEAKEKEYLNGVVLVATGDNIDVLEVVNQSDLTPLKIDTRFRVASFSKAFTAVLTMKLVEEGKLKLNGNIGTYLPDYQGEGKNKVSIHQLDLCQWH